MELRKTRLEGQLKTRTSPELAVRVTRFPATIFAPQMSRMADMNSWTIMERSAAGPSGCLKTSARRRHHTLSKFNQGLGPITLRVCAINKMSKIEGLQAMYNFLSCVYIFPDLY